MFDFFKRLFNKKYKLYYFGGKKNINAGDIFNVDLVKYFNIRCTRSKKIEDANLICVGSNVDKLSIPSKHKMLIVGAGYILPPSANDNLGREIEVLALRGKLTKSRMEKLLKIKLNDCVLGDPALLISKMYPKNLSKKFKVGIIPHYADKALLDETKIYLNKDSYKIIDIQQKPSNLVSEICECECILSSSLHGLIFADSYNIPNRQIIISDNIIGGNYKFEDYYSAFDMMLPQTIDLRDFIINEELIEKVVNNYTEKSIYPKQKELIKVFNLIGKRYG